MTTIKDHYTDCYIDYKRAWHADKTKSLHFGYYQTGEETHKEAVIKMIEMLARHGGLTEHDVVLDAGCGWGGGTCSKKICREYKVYVRLRLGDDIDYRTARDCYKRRIPQAVHLPSL